MEIYEFQAILDIKDRFQTVWEIGEFQANHVGEETSSSLYLINNFFVEIVHSNADNKIIEIVPFKRGERFEKFADKVKISI